MDNFLVGLATVAVFAVAAWFVFNVLVGGVLGLAMRALGG